VSGGGSTARMHRVVVGLGVGCSAFMHTGFDGNDCVNGHGGGAVRVRRDRGVVRHGSRVYACVF
jgi:hypothetical protein